MRYIPLFLFVGICVASMLMVLSDYVFGEETLRRTAKRIGLCIVWPLAVLSKAGRELLFTNFRGEW